ncbi:hypothetical protein C0991_007445 [Blastosporella zonata]|nr:hypothetical protein C0991_007445 [Blastosporella zonata]
MTDEHVRFVLTGEYEEDGRTYQAFIDPIQNRVEEDHQLSVLRDYDSLLGISEIIMVTDNISVFTVPHPSFALKSGLHFKYHLNHDNYDAHVEFHKIPNFEFAKFGARHHLHIFFPRLWDAERSNSRKPYLLHDRERAIWYERGMRPAIASLLGDHIASEWPATLEAEEVRARQARGNFAWGTKMIPADAVVDLADRIRRHLHYSNLTAEDREWSTTFFILHTIRGAKSISHHQVDEESSRHLLDKFLNDAHISRDIRTIGDWYIDVAVEIISDQGDCLQWLTSTHNEVVRQALRIGPERAERITSLTSSKYSRDSISHLTAVSGFRIVPGSLATGPFEAKYIQAYTTDKAVTANHDGIHHGKFVTTKNAMVKEQPASQISGMFTIYEAARTNNASKARLEMRVPFEFATRALLEFDAPLLKQCLGVFSPQEWWTFRITRLLAASQALSNQASAPPQLRVHPQALALTAACVWLINGLHARPEDGPAARRLMDAALPLTEDDGASIDTVAYRSAVPPVGDLHYHEGGEQASGPVAEYFEEETDDESEDEDQNQNQREQQGMDENEGNGERQRRVRAHLQVGIPHNPYGCVFFRRLHLGEVARLRIGGPVLTRPSFKFWFGVTIEELTDKLVRTGIVDKDIVRATRSTTNKRAIPLYHNWNPEPEADLFAIGRPGQLVPPPAFDDGSDVDDAGTPPPPAQTVNTVISELWRQFCVDILSKSPNPQGNTKASYLKLNDVARRRGGEEVFQNFVLSDTFRCVSYKFAPEADWRRAFKWFFPPRGYRISSSVQNYPSCPYFTRWMEFANNQANSKKTVVEVREALWLRLFSWDWIPDAQQDKMWPTTCTNNPDYTRAPPSFKANGKPNPAPRVLLHSTGAFRFDVDEN